MKFYGVQNDGVPQHVKLSGNDEASPMYSRVGKETCDRDVTLIFHGDPKVKAGSKIAHICNPARDTDKKLGVDGEVIPEEGEFDDEELYDMQDLATQMMAQTSKGKGK